MNTTTTPTAATPRAQAGNIPANRHQQMDGSYRTMGAPGKFEAFGAVECYAVPSHAIGMGGRGPTFMIKLADGLWHYAHDSRGSYYAAAQGYDAPSGELAWLYFVQAIRAQKIESCRIALSEAEAEFKDAQNAVADLVSRTNANATLPGKPFHPGETLFDDTCAG